MNMRYLDSLPEVKNDFGLELEENEKLVFVSKLSMLGTEKSKLLSAAGWDCFLYLTNKKLIVYNGAGLWTCDIAEDLVSCEKIERRTLFFKPAFHSLAMLNKEIVYNDGKEKLSGFEFYFEKGTDDMARFEEIMRRLFS